MRPAITAGRTSRLVSKQEWHNRGIFASTACSPSGFKPTPLKGAGVQSRAKDRRLARCVMGTNLGYRHCDTVPRNNLRLIAKHLAGCGIHEHLDPLHVVGAVRLVVTKRLQASEIFQSASL